MDTQTFEKFRDLIYRESGIVLPPQKLSLLLNRIQKRLRALDIESEAEYLEVIESDASGDELVNLIDAVSTNVTYFYREEMHFQVYRQILKQWQNEGKREIKVWCAAASTGEEPYTLAFEASEVLNPAKTKVKILGTDICSAVLKKAMRGRYSEKGTEKIPSQIRQKYMTPIEYEDESYFQVNRETMDLVKFRMFNLVKFPYALSGPVDIIFCRNVMIYFDTPTRQKITNEFSRILAPGGYLFVSLSENLIGVNHPLKKTNSTIFQKPGENK